MSLHRKIEINGRRAGGMLDELMGKYHHTISKMKQLESEIYTFIRKMDHVNQRIVMYEFLSRLETGRDVYTQGLARLLKMPEPPVTVNYKDSVSLRPYLYQEALNKQMSAIINILDTNVTPIKKEEEQTRIFSLVKGENDKGYLYKVVNNANHIVKTYIGDGKLGRRIPIPIGTPMPKIERIEEDIWWPVV